MDDESLGELIVQISADVSQLTAGLTSANNSVQGFANNAANGLNTFTQGMRQTSRELSQLAGVFALVGAAGIAPFVAALASSKDTVLSVNQTMTQLSSIGAAFGRTIATDILPGLQEFVNSLNGLLNWFNQLDQPTRAAIENFILMSSVVALVTAGVLKFASEAVRFTNDIALLTERLLAENAAGLIMLGWIALAVVAIGAIVVAMVKWQGVANTVMTALQVAFQSILIVLNTVGLGVIGLFELLVDSIEGVVTALAKIPGPQQATFQAWQKNIDGVRQNLQGLASQDMQNVVNLSQKMSTEVTTGTGSWAQGFQTLKNNITAAVTAYHNGSTTMINDTSALDKQIVTLTNNLKQITLENANQQFLTLKQNLTDAINLGKFYQSEFTIANQSITNGIIDTAKALQSNLSSAIGDIVSGAESGAQAFAALGQAMIKTIVDYIAQWIIAKGIMAVLNLTGTTSAVAAANVAGPAIAAAYGPAALAAMIASFGGAGVAAAGGFATATAAEIASMGAARISLAVGTDNVPAMLSPGEMVIPNSFASAIRAGNLSLSGPAGGTTNNTNDNGTNITIQIIGANITSNQDVSNIAQAIAIQTNRQLQYPRRRTR